MEKLVKLDYAIHKYSSYSANYVPENIKVDTPTDQGSRWFTDSNTPAQYLLLKLPAPAVVHSISFGKYGKPHVSNLKRFRVYGGSEESNLTLLLTAGLKNDNQMEAFQLRHRTTEGLEFPVLYIKIEPVQSWGPAYNYTIWHIHLQGINDEQHVRSALYTINLRKEEEAVRILLKQLRRRRYKDAFEALSRETGVRLEGAAQTRLWHALVEQGDYERAEHILERAVEDGEFDWYLSWQPYTPTWTQISPSASDQHVCSHEDTDSMSEAAGYEPDGQVIESADACCDRDWMNGGASNAEEALETSDSDACCCRPGPRGGHQLVVDSTTGTLYLFGGWDGTVDLDDLWSFKMAAGKWTRLCAHSGRVGGPAPRSCHKMVLDPVHQKIYTLGRYLDQAHRVPDNMKSDLYVYDIAAGEWTLLCADTATVGGPSLVFDHQMCIDVDTQTIYVFGGRLLPTATDERVKYSGLYAYYCVTDTWQLLLADHEDEYAPLARVGHSMLFHPIQRRLYIFAGQRHRAHLLDMWWWDVETGRCGALAGPAHSPSRPPAAAGFTQRATIDPHADEIHVLSGLSKEKDKCVCNVLWVFSLRRGTWSCVYRNDAASAADPPPRFAHQLVYDAAEKVHYLFGGNPGLSSQPRCRLDDLWQLRLTRPPSAAALRRARAAVRETQYRELVTRAAEAKSLEPSVQAVEYLRERLHDTVDHNDPEQVEKFKRLPTALFAGVTPPESAPPSLTPSLTRRLARRKARAGAVTGGAELSRALAAVLGAEDAAVSTPAPFDDAPELEPEPADVGDAYHDDDSIDTPDVDDELRAARIQLYDNLSQYFRPSQVPPKADVYDLIKLCQPDTTDTARV